MNTFKTVEHIAEDGEEIEQLVRTPDIEYNLNAEEILPVDVAEDLAAAQQRERRVLEYIDNEQTDSEYTPVQKMQAVTAFVLTGSPLKASRLSGVPSPLIRRWKNTAGWWSEAVKEARKRKQDQFDGIITGLLDKTLGEIADRLVAGDQMITSSGKKYRKKLSARDLVMVWNTLFEKRALMRGDMKMTTGNQKDTFEKDMQALVDKLTEVSTGIIKKSENRG